MPDRGLDPGAGGSGSRHLTGRTASENGRIGSICGPFAAIVVVNTLEVGCKTPSSRGEKPDPPNINQANVEPPAAEESHKLFIVCEIES